MIKFSNPHKVNKINIELEVISYWLHVWKHYSLNWQMKLKLYSTIMILMQGKVMWWLTPSRPLNNNWRAPWKGGVCTYSFPLKLAMLTLSVLKKCPCGFFFHKRGNKTKRGGGGGGISRNFVHIFCLTQKESACLISVDSEQLEKSQRNRYIRLPAMEPFNCALRYFVLWLAFY